MTVRKGPVDVRPALFGGVGEVRVWNLLADHSHTPHPITAVLSCELDPNGHVGRHVQQQFPEIVVGLSGDGEAWVDGKPTPLGEGDVVYLPLGSTLELRNHSSVAPLAYLIIKARG
jgi:mannose-6-phosphate isomerase-like protein (cupin superfamily)